MKSVSAPFAASAVSAIVVGVVIVVSWMLGSTMDNNSFEADAVRHRRGSCHSGPRRTTQRFTSMGYAMRRLFFLIMFIVAVSPAMAGTAFQSDRDFSPWLTFYYENPDPNRVPDAIRYMSKSGILDKDSAIPPISGFLSGVFRNNPDKVASWLSQLNSLKEQHLGVVVLGVWYAALPDSQKIVYGLLKKHPKLKPHFEFLYQGTPMIVEQIPLEQGSWVLDALWGKFMATGDSAPVERIISTLPWIDVKGDVNRLVIGGSAGWSLTSNAVQHKRVLELCEAAEKTQTAEVAAKLREVIKNAKNELQTRHNPPVNTDAAR